MDTKKKLNPEENSFLSLTSNNRRKSRFLIKGRGIRQFMLCILLLGVVLAATQNNFPGAGGIRKIVHYTLNTNYNLTPWLQRWHTLEFRPDVTVPTFSGDRLFNFSGQADGEKENDQSALSNQAGSSNLSTPPLSDFIYPVTAGKVVKLFDPLLAQDGFYPGSGITIETPPGQMVRAGYPGNVIGVTPDQQFGYAIQIDHGQGIYSITTGCASVQVRSGDQVVKGQIIGQMESPSEEKKYLYFEVRRQGTPVDPLTFIQDKGNP